MRVRHASLRWFALILVLALVAAACGDDDVVDTTTTTAPPEATTTTEAPVPGGTVTAALGEPAFLDPNLQFESEGFQVARLLFDGLTLYDPAGGAVVPGVAHSWESSADNTVWTFYLHENASFHDGTPLTAQDFVYGISRLADPDTGASVAYHGGPGYADILGWDDVNQGEGTGVSGDEFVEGVVALDDYTLQITTASPNNLLPKILAHPAFSPVPQAAFEADPEAWAEMPIGNGPYMMREPWQHDVSITLDRYEGYYGTPGRPDTVQILIIADVNARYDALRAGTIDMMAGIPAEFVEQARIEFGDRFSEIETGVFTYVGFPTQESPYDDLDIRRALVMAIDRDAINSQILVGRTTANGFVPPVAFGSIDGECEYCRFDPAAAAALFEAAGGIPGNQVSISFNAGAGHEEWIEAIANDWRNNLGLEVDFISMEWVAYLEFLGYAGDPFSVYPTQPYRLGWLWDYPSAYNFLAPLYMSTSADNRSSFFNDRFDELMLEAITAASEDDAVPFMVEAQRILAEELPVIPINYGLTRFAWNDTVDNVSYNDFGFFLWEDVVVLP